MEEPLAIYAVIRGILDLTELIVAIVVMMECAIIMVLFIQKFLILIFLKNYVLIN